MLLSDYLDELAKIRFLQRMKETFKNKKVTIMGLGLHGGGGGAAKFFCKQGARVVVTDLKSKKELQKSLLKLKGLQITYVLGRHREKDFREADLIIKNPDVKRESPYLAIARRHGVPIKTDIEIVFERTKAQIIGVTGSKGKSTVATLIYQFLKKKYPSSYLAGNIGGSPLENLHRFKRNSKVVLELSSFELEDMKQSPAVAVITTLLPDHLNRYKNFREYCRAKRPIFEYQQKKDILVLNYDDSRVRAFAKDASSRVYFYSTKSKKGSRFACFIKKGALFFNEEKHPICQIESYFLQNIVAAASVAKLLRVSSLNIREVLLAFKGLPHRQEYLQKKAGVQYVNDTTATMPDAAILALRTMRQKFPEGRLILIAGGHDKKLEYKKMAREIQKTVHYLILLPGDASEKIKKEIASIPLSLVKSMKLAVNKASQKARKGDVVLLSPGATSFGLFQNEFDRGEQFRRAVSSLL